MFCVLSEIHNHKRLDILDCTPAVEPEYGSCFNYVSYEHNTGKQSASDSIFCICTFCCPCSHFIFLAYFTSPVQLQNQKRGQIMASVFLCGQKDCGKTYFLNKLIKSSKVNAYDLDELILKTTGEQSVRVLYEKIGEKEFRKTEEQTFDNLISFLNGKDAVIALGGGATLLLGKANRYGQTVYLYQLPEILYERMEKEGLPSFVKDRESFMELFNKRNSEYMQNCTKIIDLFQTEEEEVCQTLSAMYLN